MYKISLSIDVVRRSSSIFSVTYTPVSSISTTLNFKCY